MDGATYQNGLSIVEAQASFAGGAQSRFEYVAASACKDVPQNQYRDLLGDWSPILMSLENYRQTTKKIWSGCNVPGIRPLNREIADYEKNYLTYRADSFINRCGTLPGRKRNS